MAGAGWLAEDGYLLAGEFHYFRVPADQWADRLTLMAGAGLTAVSTYVPWNWHQAHPGGMDLTGATCAEKNLLGALDAIAAAGLQCILRPGPYITSEWRGGGIPTWLWEQHPEVLALRLDGTPTAIDPYPVLTYDHPQFRQACRDWYDAVLPAVAGHLASVGGPIVNVQLDDEPSYWQRLAGDPTQTDYNPVLVRGDGGPSLYARWLLDRYGDLAALRDAHRIDARSAEQVEPPRLAPRSREDLVRHLDWFEFKLSCVDRFVELLYDCLRQHDPVTPVSLLHPYLLPLTAGRYRSRSPGCDLPIQLTNEVYSSLFGPTSSREPKVAAIVSTHEAYHAWRGPEPAVTMEIQASNATYLPSGAMELLYAVSVARGIKGLCFYMMVGGTNPPGYELGTGPSYDVSAPISRTGGTRAHYGVIRKLADVLEAVGPDLHSAEPLRDVAFGWWVPYEEAALWGSETFADVTESMATTFDTGAIGTSEALPLQSLMTDASVSYGYLDLETCSDDEIDAARQLWVPALDRMPRVIQDRLARYAERGGDLVLVPGVPALDERGGGCDVLTRMAFGTEPPPAYLPPEPFRESWQRIMTAKGRLLLAAPPVTALPVAPGAEVLATLDQTRPDSTVPAPPAPACAVRRAVGSGQVTVLGFRLQYVPTESDEHRAFLLDLLRDSPATSAAPAPLVAMQLQGAGAGIVCVVNPVPVPVAGRVRYRSGGGDRVLPAVLEALAMPGQGARLLPVDLDLGAFGVLRSSTWELVQRLPGAGAGASSGAGGTAAAAAAGTAAAGSVQLTFETAGDSVGEVVLSGGDCTAGDGTCIVARVPTEHGTALLLTATGPRAHLTLHPTPTV